MAQSDTTIQRAFWEKIVAHAASLANWLGGLTARLTTFALMILLVVYWAYIAIWLPLSAELPLPTGVSEDNPIINTEVLQQISDQRTDRIEHQLPPIFVGGLITPIAPAS